MLRPALLFAAFAAVQAAHSERYYSNVTLAIRVMEDTQDFSKVSGALNTALIDFCKQNAGAPTDVQQYIGLDFFNVQPSVEFLSESVVNARFYSTVDTVNTARAAHKYAFVVLDEGAVARQAPEYRRRFNDTTTLRLVQDVTVDCKHYDQDVSPAWEARYDFVHTYHQCEDDDSTSNGHKFAYAVLVVVIIGFLVGGAMIITGGSNQGQPAPVGGSENF